MIKRITNALCSDSEDDSDQEISFSIDDDNVAQISEAQFFTFQSFVRDLDERLATDEIGFIAGSNAGTDTRQS